MSSRLSHISIMFLVAVLVAGCETINPYTGETQTSKATKGALIGAAAGAVAGLVAITPASGFVEPAESIIIGALAGALCYGAVRLRVKVGLDDSLDVVAVHGVGGIWGGIATGLFASATVGGVDGRRGVRDIHLRPGTGQQLPRIGDEVP